MKNHTINVQQTLITLLLYSVVFPFVFFPPLRTDLQPLAGLLAFLVMLRFTKMKFTQIQLYVGFLLGFLSVLSIIFILIGLVTMDGFNLGLFQFSKIFSLFYGLIILYVFESNQVYFRKEILNRSIIIYAVCTVAYLILRGNYLAIQSLVVNARGVDMTAMGATGSRGVSILSPEPSVFSSILIFLLRLNDHFFYDQPENTRKRFRMNFLLITLMIVFNKSATGLFMFFFYLLFFFFKHVKYTWAYIVGFVSVVFIGLINLDLSGSNNRSLILLLQLMEKKNVSFFDVLLLDPSFNSRFQDWALGFYSLITYPFGVGYPFFYVAIDNVIKANGLKTGTPPVGSGLVSPLAYAIITFGIFIFALIAMLLLKKKAYWFDKFYFFYNISFSISFAFPLSWAILTINKKNITK